MPRDTACVHVLSSFAEIRTRAPADGRYAAARHCLRQFHAMFSMRLLYLRYRPFVTFLQVTVPIGFSLAVLYATGQDPARTSPPLLLSLSRFGGSMVAYSTSEHHSYAVQNMSSQYSDLFRGSPNDVVHANNQTGAPHLEEFLLSLGKRDLSVYTYTYFVAAELLNRTYNGTNIDVTAFFNYKAHHTAAISLNLADNALLRYHAGSEYAIQTTNHPLWLPSARTQHLMQLLSDGDYLQMSLTVAVVTGLVLLMSSLVDAPIHERISGAKQRQLSAGLWPSISWSTQFLCDYTLYALSCAVIVAALLAWDPTTLTGGSPAWLVAALFALYGWAMIPFIYLASFYFSDSSRAFAWFTFYNVITGEGRLSS